MRDFMIWSDDQDESEYEVFEGETVAKAIEVWAEEQEGQLDGLIVYAVECELVHGATDSFVKIAGAPTFSAEIETRVVHVAIMQKATK